MPWETFQRRQSRPVGEPFLTIQRKGIFSLNRAALDALGGTDWVELLYDPDARMVALRPVESVTEHAYQLRRLGGASGGTGLISGIAFTHHYGIDTSKSLRRVARMHDGLLVIDLNDPGTEVTSNRAGNGNGSST